MPFIIAIAAVLIERFTGVFRPVRQLTWFERYQGFLLDKMNYRQAPAIAAIVLPAMLIAGFIYWALCGWFFGIAGFIFQLLVLLLCLGDGNIQEHIERYQSLTTDADPKTADEYFKTTFSLLPPQGEGHVLNAIYTVFNQRIFSVLFWFAVLGPLGVMGAVMYRSIHCLAAKAIVEGKNEEVYTFSVCLLNLLDWIPVRLLTFSFCLVGSFMAVFPEWCKLFAAKPRDNADVLEKCGDKGVNLSDEALKPEAQQSSVLSLVNRSLLVWLVVFALIVVF